MEPVSIIIPAYNRAPRLTKTLASVLAQSYRPIHLILVDNDSSDATPEIMKAFAVGYDSPDFKVSFYREKNRGASSARNLGLQAADTEWVMFFDSDDIMLPDHVARAMATTRENPDADIVGWPCTFIYEKTGRKVRKPFPVHNLYYNTVIHGTMGTQHYMARRELFQRAGAWNPTLSTWDDIELAVRLLNLNPKVVATDSESMVDISVHDDSITGPGFLATADTGELAMDAIEAHLATENRKWLSLRRALIAGHYAAEGDKPRARTLLNRALADGCVNPRLLRIAYTMRSHNLRGSARILFPLIK